MAAFLPMIAIASSAVQAIGAIRNGNIQANVAKANAAALDTQAEETRRATVSREELQRQHARAVIGDQLAGGAETGTTLSGSNLDSLQQSMFNAEMDALQVRYQGLTQANDLNNEATQTRWRGRQARIGGYLAASSALLNGASSYINASGKIPMMPTEKQAIHVGGY